MSSAGLQREVLSFIRRYSERSAPEKAFGALALRIFAFQFQANPLYGRYCRSLGRTPANARGWREIPAMPAAGFKELVLTSFPRKRSVKVFRTSGTTRGPAGRGAHHFETLKLYEASILPPFRRHVLSGKSYDLRFLIAPSSEAPDSSLSHMMGVVDRVFARGRGRFYARRNALDLDHLEADLDAARRPVLLLSTAFALKAFLDHLKGAGRRLKLPRGSRIMETGGFKGRANEVSKRELYRMCAERLGVPRGSCVSEYGMTELSSQYYASGGGAFRAPAWMRASCVDPRTGRQAARGLLRHVDLANLGSVIAVQTEDMGRLVPGGFVWTGRATGAEARGCSLSYERFLTEGA